MDFSQDFIQKLSESMLIDDEVVLRKQYLQLNDEDVSLLQNLNQQINKKDESYIADFYSRNSILNKLDTYKTILIVMIRRNMLMYI